MNKLKIALPYKLFFALTLVYVYIITSNDIYVKKYDIGHSEIVGTIIDIKYDDDKVTFIISAKEKLKVTKYKNNNYYEIGDKVKVSGEINNPSNNTIFNLFNYRNYLFSNGIHMVMTADKIEKIGSNKLYKIKNSIYKRIDNLESKRYIKTFVLGDKSELDSDIKHVYQENGISHLLAISGMHISLLASVLAFMLKKIKHHHLIISMFLLFYAFLTGFTPSVIRATLFFMFSKSIDIKKLIIIVACCMLIYNPYYIYNVGFLFSFIISFYLIMFGNITNRFHNYFVKVFIVSLISFLAGLPIVINNFYNINLSSIFLNIIFVPLVSFLIFPLSLLTLIFPFLDIFLVMSTNILEHLSVFCNQFNVNIIMCFVPLWMFLLYYIIITFALRNIRGSLLLILILIVHANVKQFDTNYYVTSLDIGQGDSTLLEIKNKIVMIDTGGITGSDYKLVDNKTIPYLKSRGIKNISFLILTHGDFDHMGEAINLVNNFKVEKVIFNCGEYNDLEKELIKVLDRKKIKYYSCIKELNIDKNKLYFLQTKEYDNENDNSNVIYTELSGYKFMFMGDASAVTEKEIINKYNLPNIDILKVGHHGSRTSSGKEFIDEINPKYSVISVGKNNRYGHPNKEVLNNLKYSKIYRTDKDGSIMFKIKSNKLKIETCSP